MLPVTSFSIIQRRHRRRLNELRCHRLRLRCSWTHSYMFAFSLHAHYHTAIAVPSCSSAEGTIHASILVYEFALVLTFASQWYRLCIASCTFPRFLISAVVMQWTVFRYYNPQQFIQFNCVTGSAVSMANTHSISENVRGRRNIWSNDLNPSCLSHNVISSWCCTFQKQKIPRPVAIKILRELLHAGLFEFWARTTDREIGPTSDLYDSSRVFYTFAFDSPDAAAASPVAQKSETFVHTTTTVTKSVVFHPSDASCITRIKADGSLRDRFTRALTPGGTFLAIRMAPWCFYCFVSAGGDSQPYRGRSTSFQLQLGRRETVDSSTTRERTGSFSGHLPHRYVHCHFRALLKRLTICSFMFQDGHSSSTNGQEMTTVHEDSDSSNSTSAYELHSNAAHLHATNLS